MKVNTVRFVKSAMDLARCPRDGKPEFAFVGRSNVGKSSLLNALMRRKGLAKTSNTPGRTQTINYFEVNGRVYLVDLPGYGYAKAPVKLKDTWNRVMQGYLREREPLRMAAVLVDARHDPTALDQEMVALLEEAEKPTLVVATKYDKLKAAERQRNLARIRDTLGLDEEAYVLPFSAVKGTGVKELWGIMGDFL